MSAFNGPGVTFSRNSGTSTTDKKERKKGGGLINGGEFGILKSKNKKRPRREKERGKERPRPTKKQPPPLDVPESVFFFASRTLVREREEQRVGRILRRDEILSIRKCCIMQEPPGTSGKREDLDRVGTGVRHKYADNCLNVRFALRHK